MMIFWHTEGSNPYGAFTNQSRRPPSVSINCYLSHIIMLNVQATRLQLICKSPLNQPASSIVIIGLGADKSD